MRTSPIASEVYRYRDDSISVPGLPNSKRQCCGEQDKQMITEHKSPAISDGRVSHENSRLTNSSDLEKDVAAIPFLRGLSARHIAILAACAGRSRFKENQIIFRQGEAADRFYLIEGGMVELESASRGILAGSISSGGALGWSWLFPPYQWQFTARALRETSAIIFCATNPAPAMRGQSIARP